MDPLLAAAARALSAGDPLGSLRLIALREDATALALRGIALAQLGDLARADALLARAERAFPPDARLERARCVVARAEVALAARELRGDHHAALERAVRTLQAYRDRANALHGHLVQVRGLLLLGQLDAASESLARLDLTGAPDRLIAAGAFAIGEVALRRLHARAAHVAFEQAHRAAERSGIPALVAEIEAAREALSAPAARLLERGAERAVTLGEVEDALSSERLWVDACRRTVRAGPRVVTLTTRPILFALLRALAQAWPGDVARDDLIRQVFEVHRVNDSHRVRLRVAIGRLRPVLHGLGTVKATPRGFALVPAGGRSAAVLAPPSEDLDSTLLALLSDGQAWSASALALALGVGARTVQRRLSTLAAAARVRPVGRARMRRWVTSPAVGLTPALLLPALPPLG